MDGSDYPSPPLPAFLLGGDLLHAAYGDAADGEAADLRAPSHLLGLRRPAGLASLATPIGDLQTPLRTLARRLQPDRILVDQGGQGNCGPNTLAYMLGLVGLTEADGVQLRRLVSNHSKEEGVLQRTTSILLEDDTLLSMEKLIMLNINHWPETALQGKPRSVATWQELILQPETWTDVAFVQLAADLFRVSFHHIGVDDLSSVFDMGTITPCDGAASVALCEIGVWYNRHFVAILDVLMAAQGAKPTPPKPPSLPGSDALLSFSFPLRSLAEVRRFIASFDRVSLVGFEFSGAMRTALEASFDPHVHEAALSADLRPCEVGGPHYQGDVHDILHLTTWHRAFFFPPCFQQLRGDLDCIEAKILDKRAFWGCLQVLYCIVGVSALMVFVEQPDTIFGDCFDPAAWPAVELYEFRTSHYEDLTDKFVRLTTRNVCLQAPTQPFVRSQPAPRSQFDYRDADERDRQRSSWTPHVQTCRVLAAATPLSPELPPAIPIVAAIESFAAEYHLLYGNVPSGYLSQNCRPLNAEDRAYQMERGRGHGRLVPSVLPVSLSEGPVRVRPNGAIVSFEPPLELSSDDEEADDSDDRENGVRWSLAATGCSEQSGADEPARHGVPPPAFTPLAEQLVSIQATTGTLAIVLFVCVIGQPLVLAHLDGFTAVGIHTTASTRSAILGQIKALCSVLVSAAHMIFMIGQYLAGAKLFAAPVDFAPEPATICRSRAQRLAWLAQGATFAWCTLAALQGTPIADATARAFATTEMFRGPATVLPDDTVEGVQFDFGASSARSVARRPADERTAPAWSALQRMLRQDEALADSILESVAGGDTLLEGWAERVQPLDTSSVPRELLEHAPSFDDERLDNVLLSPPLEPLRLSWLPLPPPQRPVSPQTPACPTIPDMIPSVETRDKAERWFKEALSDLVSIRDQLAAGVPPADIHRGRREAIAIGQTEMAEWARDRVWDCRGECCVLSDFRALPDSHLDLSYLKRRLRHYPDQYLAANILEGVRLDADVELQSVWVPHLTSLPFGYASVGKELRRLRSMGWYEFFSSLPFWPMYLNGQGATARKLEPDRYRRTTEGGGPRAPTFDASGLQAISINEASHLYHMPRHFQSDERPEFREWLQARGLPAPSPAPASPTVRFSKWPKERKPQLASVMRDNSVFNRAGHLLGEPTYGFEDDAKDYFNQLAMASSELHKVGTVFLAEAGDLPLSGGEPAEGTDRLVFVSERRLGFGTHGASNIAQRFSDALVDWYREDMDVADAEARQGAGPQEREWLHRRLALQRRYGLPCVDIHRWTRAPETVLPDIPAPTTVDAIPPGYVCPQLRLFSAYMYTDDPLFLTVGLERTKRALRVWRKLTNAIRLIMAIPEKRTLGSWGKWLGVNVISNLGLVVVPRDKILRASAAIADVLEAGVQFHVYRSLCGLLEHLRAVNLQARNIMFGLYRPHGPTGASKFGPTGWVTCDPLMRKQLLRWQTLLFGSCGVSVKHALLRTELEEPPNIFFDVTSDACLADVDRAGIGGFCHGLYWFYEVPEDVRPCMTIPVLEFLAVGCGLLTFFQYLRGATRAEADGARIRILLRTDALTTALALPASSANSEALQEVDEHLRSTTEWEALVYLLAVAHLYGDCNPAADLISRQRWAEFHQLCALLNIRPRRVPLTPAAHALIDTAISAARRQRARRLQGGLASRAATSGWRMRAASISMMRVGCNPSIAERRRLETQRSLRPVPHSTPPPSQLVPIHSPVRGPTLAETRRAKAETALRPARHPYQRSNQPPAAPAASGSLVVTPGGPRSRVVGGLAVPPPLPARNTTLAAAGKRYSQEQMLNFAAGHPDMAFSADLGGLWAIGGATEETVSYGINHNTAKMDERAWVFWEHICSVHGTSPLRTEQDVREFPARNAHLLAALLMYAFTVCKPKSKGRQFVKPSSALAYPLAIIRIFGRWSILMPGFKYVSKALDGLKRLYLAHHGPHSLAPKRAENMRFSMVASMQRIPADGSLRLGSVQWDDVAHDVFIFRRLTRFMMFTGFRLAEIVGNGSGEVMFLTFGCLFWCIDNVMVARPTREQLLSMRPGRDSAVVFPPRSKPDQWGETHCPFPVRLTYETTELNSAAALRDLELRVGVSVADRDAYPLFGDAAGRTYTHHYLHNLLQLALTHLYGATVAALYTWHSFRSGLATALHAAGVSDAMIMLICRWMCAESLHVYRRMGTREHERLINTASTMNVDAIQSANVVQVVGDQGYAALFNDLSLNTRAHLRDFEQASRAALDPDARQLTPVGPTASPVTAAPTGLRTGERALQPAIIEPPARLFALPEAPLLGDDVVVPAEVWPAYSCRELGGAGWTATVTRVHESTARVSFLLARTRDGRPYQDELLPLSALRTQDAE